MLAYPETTRRWQFRLLVGLIFLSLVQDVLWFVLNRDIEDDEDDGGLEKTVKGFSRTMSFVSFIWRVSLNTDNYFLVKFTLTASFCISICLTYNVCFDLLLYSLFWQ